MCHFISISYQTIEGLPFVQPLASAVFNFYVLLLFLRNCLLVCSYSTVFLQINIGVVTLRDSGSMGSSKCVVYDNGKSSTCSIKCKSCIAVRKAIPYIF